MGVAPEVLLDRYLGSQKTRDVYKGKQALNALEPSLGSLLANIQDTINADLRQPSNTFAMGRLHNFHFDYVDSTCLNALAFEHEGYAFLCVTTPLVRILWRMCERLSKSAKVAEVLRVGAATPEPEAILAVLFTTQFAFIVAHEFAHHDRGHFKPQDSKAGLWEEIQSANALGSLQQQAREADADGWAVYLALTHLVKGKRRDITLALLGLQSAPDGLVEEALLPSFIVAVATALFVFPPSEFDERTLYQLTHPPQAARMNIIMTSVKVWCQQNRPGLWAWLTLERFQMLMSAAREATSGLSDTRNWSKQEEFFHTQAGAEYFKRLHELVVSLIADEKPTTEMAPR